MKYPDVNEFFTMLHSVLKGNESYPLHQPELRGNEWSYVKDCLDTGWVSSIGSYVARFEHDLQQYTGINHAIAVVNGTAALHTCLMLCNVHASDEVLLPAFTFVATANAIRYCQAEPHFVDVSPTTLGVDPEKLSDYLDKYTQQVDGVCVNKNTQRPIPALIVMHTFGHPAELDDIQALCEQHNIVLIEDAAQALGSFYKGKHVGNWGKVSAFSFNGNKIITTGGGGAVLTNDESIAKYAHHITTTAKLPHQWSFVHNEVGYNYRLPNINAALGCAQLERLPGFVDNKRRLAARYRTAFQNSSLGEIISESAVSMSNYWLNCFQLAPEHAGLRDELLAKCYERKILVRPAWELMHRLPMYKKCQRMDVANAEMLESTLICLPSSPALENMA